MPEFIYQGIDRTGRKQKGRLSAEARTNAMMSLRERGITIISIKEQAPPRPAFAPGIGGVSVGHLSIFTRKFAQLTKTDIPITVALEILSDEEESPMLREALDHVVNQISAGMPIGQSMAERPRVFSRLYIRMIEAGLNSGTLDLVAENLAKLYENETTLRKQLWSKLAYPIGLLAFCFLAAIVLKTIGFLSNGTFGVLMSFWIVIGGLAILGMTRPGYKVYREIGFRLPESARSCGISISHDSVGFSVCNIPPPCRCWRGWKFRKKFFRTPSLKAR